jgi:hypothetical protein
MILYPLDSGIGAASTPRQDQLSERAHPEYVSPWLAVERKQKQMTEEWMLITQPDHAALAGDLAARLNSSLIPKLDNEVLEGISLHDSGWAQFDGGERGTGHDLEVTLRDPQMSDSGKPISFLEVGVEEALTAWQGSIANAEQGAAIAGILVSEHFCRITQERLRTKTDTPEDSESLHAFLRAEEERQKGLRARQRRSNKEIRVLIDVLQFCDLLSLYLCCGTRERVEFPQRFSGSVIRADWEDKLLRTQPSLFGEGASLGVLARRFPISGALDVSTLGLLVQ